VKRFFAILVLVAAAVGESACGAVHFVRRVDVILDSDTRDRAIIVNNAPGEDFDVITGGNTVIRSKLHYGETFSVALPCSYVGRNPYTIVVRRSLTSDSSPVGTETKTFYVQCRPANRNPYRQQYNPKHITWEIGSGVAASSARTAGGGSSSPNSPNGAETTGVNDVLLPIRNMNEEASIKVFVGDSLYATIPPGGIDEVGLSCADGRREYRLSAEAVGVDGRVFVQKARNAVSANCSPRSRSELAEWVVLITR